MLKFTPGKEIKKKKTILELLKAKILKVPTFSLWLFTKKKCSMVLTKIVITVENLVFPDHYLLVHK